MEDIIINKMIGRICKLSEDLDGSSQAHAVATEDYHCIRGKYARIFNNKEKLRTKGIKKGTRFIQLETKTESIVSSYNESK